MKSVVERTCAISACVDSLLVVSQGGVWAVEVVVASPKEFPDEAPDDEPPDDVEPDEVEELEADEGNCAE